MSSIESPSPFQYQQVASEVLAYIQTHQLKAGDRLPSEREFASKLQIGRPTINKGLACLISEGRLRRDGYKLYVTSPAINLSSKAYICVLGQHPLQNKQRVSHNLVEAAHDVCLLSKARFVPMLSMDGPQQRAQLLEVLKEPPDGIVIWPHPTEQHQDILRQFVSRGIAVVVCDINYGPFDFVGVNNYAGIQRIVSHLHELEHREIAYFTRPISNSNLVERANSFRYNTFQLRMGQSSKRVYELANDSDEALLQLFEKFRRTDSRVTAICCSHDALAMDLLSLCRRNNLAVPEMLSIAGFDGIETWETHASILTTVAQDFYEIGAIAVDLLIRRVRHRDFKHRFHAHQIQIAPQLIVRTSTSQPAQDTKRKRLRARAASTSISQDASNSGHSIVNSEEDAPEFKKT